MLPRRDEGSKQTDGRTMDFSSRWIRIEGDRLADEAEEGIIIEDENMEVIQIFNAKAVVLQEEAGERREAIERMRGIILEDGVMCGTRAGA